MFRGFSVHLASTHTSSAGVVCASIFTHLEMAARGVRAAVELYICGVTFPSRTLQLWFY